MADLRDGLEAELRGRYVIERELGRGGMATVFLARDLRHERPVALKVLHPELAATLGPERFLREIRLAARLQHPHILTVLDSGDAAGQLWFTMPYVEGETLRDRLRREGQLPLDDALRIARETADALDYAHQRGVVHRDVKPENILLAGRHALVADFGIARALGVGDGSGGPGLTREQRLTETGMSVGTPAYMSPEQASGDREVDARSDIYSLGCVLYEMLAGEPPFTGPTAQAILLRKFTENPRPLRAVRDTVPEAIEQAVAKALARSPADRFPSAGEFRRVLEPAAPTPGIATPPATPTLVTPAAGAPRRRSLRYPVTLALLGGFAIGLGVLFAWRRGHQADAEAGTPAAAGPKLVAVLPFENLGGADDEYFSDGITDEIRGKLSGLAGLQVTARSSSSEYKKTRKRPQDVGRELGVDYLLTGTVRWEKGQGGASRVRVSPELIQVSTGATKWQQPFDAALTDVFQVQADIAGRVAQALDVAMGAGAKERLAERPTQNLAAYDAFLKGEASYAQGNNPATLREAVGYFEQAVALDSTFATAWAGLSQAQSLLYSNASSPARADQSRTAAERAIALAPNRPEGYIALGDYYRRVPSDPQRSIEQYTKGLRLAPTNGDVLRGLGLAEQSLGRWEQAVEHLRRGQSIDPRSGAIASVLGQALLWLRRYPEALPAYDRAIELRPRDLQSFEGKAMVYLGQGDLAGARNVLAGVPKDFDPTSYAAYVATFWDLFWVLEPEQQALLLRLTPRPFDDDVGNWGLALAATHYVHGDMTRARAYADSARAALEQQLKAAPEDAQRHVLLGVALAYMGRKADAIREGEHGLALLPASKDAFSGAYNQHQLARIYILLGEPDKALDQLEPLLKIPYYLSPGWLKIDPTFAPLRGNPRFERLVKSSPAT
ncbi:MAG TPA: protein kinase [Gemmatimonadales bacterium]|nr:protein kinase [Gemmatimonadales bacterium]